MDHDLPTFTHDARRIIDCSDAACLLFRCDRRGLVDQDMLQLIHEDMRPLAALRLKFMRDPNRDQTKDLPEITYSFLRCDGTVFFGTLTTRRLNEHFETVVVYNHEW